MKNIIAAKLAEIEKSENVRILYAAESGSRAWGIASPDSDYDVRFVYVRPREFYLKLDETRDVIEWQLDKTLDINGWDLSKTLRLLHNSNPRLFEWANSPIIYKTTDEWAEIKKEMNSYFSVRSALHHYIGIAERKYGNYKKGDLVKLKRFFYVIHPVLAGKWVLHKKCPPPVPFAELVEAELEPELRPILEDILKQRSEAPEQSMGKRFDKLNENIEKNIASLIAAAGDLPIDEKADWNCLNELFFSIVV